MSWDVIMSWILKKRSILFHVIVTYFTAGIWLVFYLYCRYKQGLTYKNINVNKYQIISIFKRESLITLDNGNTVSNYVVFDVETTGLHAEVERITEFSLLKYADNKLIDKMSQLVNPRKLIPDIVSKKTGITNEMVRGIEDIEKYLDRIVEFIGDNVLIGHNINFDIDFLAAEIIRYNKHYRKIKIKYIDTVELSKALIRDVADYKLETLKQHLKIKSDSHRAYSDCLVTNELYQYCKNLIDEQIEIKKIHFQKKMDNINESERKFIESIIEKIHAFDDKLVLNINFLSSNTISFIVNEIEIGRIKLRGKNPSIQLITDLNTTWIDNITLEEAISLSDKWISYLKKRR